MIEYYSAYATFIKQYIEFKRSLGYKFKYEYEFAAFDHFLEENAITNIGLTRKDCEFWAIKRPNESDVTRYKRINDIRNFSIYLNNIGYTSYVPRQLSEYRTTFTPYIFSEEEIKSFFIACDSLKITRNSITAHIYPTVFRLIYGCGLRANEALSIKCADVNLQQKYIIIREPKNGEDRILPISDSLSNVLNSYKSSYRNNADETEFFFVKKDGDRYSVNSLYKWFRKILRIAKMAVVGLDLYYCLPLLSKYLGHKSLEATDKYVRLTADMYPSIMTNINQLCSYIFPEVNSSETN